MERESLKHLDPRLGSFRGYLKVALKNFSLKAVRSEMVRRPRDGAQLFHVDQGDASWRDLAVDAAASPEEAFDREWTRELLSDAVRELERILAAEGKELYFALFSEYYRDSLPSSERRVVASPRWSERVSSRQSSRASSRGFRTPC